MDKQHEQAIIDWVNTFQIPKSCTALGDLCDGQIIAAMLLEMCPSHFDEINFDEVGKFSLLISYWS